MKDTEELKEICKLLSDSKRIAVVGILDNPQKSSREIAEFLIDQGYDVVGVNPLIKDAGRIKVYPKLTDIPNKIDIADVFRKSEDIPELIDDVLAVKPKALWLQQGIRNDTAVKPVIDSGIIAIQDKCIAVHYNLCKAVPK